MKKILVFVFLGLLLSAQTTIKQNQLSFSTTGQVSEVITIVPMAAALPPGTTSSSGVVPIPQTFSTNGVCTGFMDVFRNGLNETIGKDFITDGTSITFLPAMRVEGGDIIKIRCFH